MAAALVTVLLASPVEATPSLVSLVGNNSSKGAATSIALTVNAGGASQGNLVTVAAALEPGALGGASCSDSRGNSYNAQVNNRTSSTWLLMCWSILDTALLPGDIITISHPSNNARSAVAQQFSGLTSNPLDTSAAGGGSGTAPATSFTSTTAQAVELLWGAVSIQGLSSDGFTAGPNYNGLTGMSTAGGVATSNQTLFQEYRVVSATGSYRADGTLGVSRNWAAGLVTFRGAPDDTTSPSDPGPPSANPNPAASGAPITLNWAASTDSGWGIRNYEVEVSTNEGASYTPLATVLTNSYSYTPPADGRYFYRVRARDNAGNLSNWAVSAALTVSSVGPPTRLAFLTQPADASAGATLSQVRVVVQDANGNTVTSVSDTITLAIPPAANPGGGTLTGGGGTATSSGVATFSALSINRVGAGYQLTATSSSGYAAALSIPFDIDPGPAASLQLAGFPSPVTSGATGSVTLTARDALGNVATGFTGQVALGSSDGQATVPGVYTFVPGDGGSRSFNVTLRTAGTQSIYVDDTSGSLARATQSGIQVRAAPAATLEISGVTSPIGVGNSTSVTVRARDAFGNVDTSYAGTISFSSSDALASLPVPFTFGPADAGSKTFSGGVRFGTGGTQSLTAQDTTSGIMGTLAGIAVTEQVPPVIAADANLKGALNQPYRYNARGAVNALSAGPVTFAACGGPAGFQVDAQTGAVRWTPDAAGTIPLCVSATNAYGQTPYNFSVVVTARSPTAVTAMFAAVPTTGSAPLAVSFDGSASQGAADALPLMHRWDFGDGSASATGASAFHRYLLPGGHRAQLTVWDAYGSSARADAQIQVQDSAGRLPPSARIVASQTSGQDALSATFSCDCRAGSSPVVAYRWDFPGRIIRDSTATASFGPGRYHVLLTVVDAAGLVATDKVEIVVSQGSRLPPTCAASATPSAGPVDLTVRLAAEASADQGNVSQLRWDIASFGTSSQASVDHTFTVPGYHAVRLLAVDEAGLTCEDALVVTALDAAGNAPPRSVTVPALEARCGIEYEYSPTGGAMAPDAATSWSLQHAPEGASIDARTGAFRWTPGFHQSGSHTVQLVGNGTAGTDQQSFQVVVSCIETDMKLACGCRSSPGFPAGAALVAWLFLLRRQA